MGDDRRSQLALEVDETAIEVLKEQDGFMYENLEKAIFDAFGGDSLDSPEAVEAEIRQAKRERQQAVERREMAEQEIHRQDQRIERLENLLESLESEKQSKAEELDALLDWLVADDDHRVWPSHGKVERIADEYYSGSNCGELVIEDLKERASERGLNLDDSRFTRGSL